MFFIYQFHVLHSKVRKWKFTHRVSNSKWNYLFVNLESVTRKQKSKSLTIELVTWSEIKYFSTSSWKSSRIGLVTRSNFFNFLTSS